MTLVVEFVPGICCDTRWTDCPYSLAFHRSVDRQGTMGSSMDNFELRAAGHVNTENRPTVRKVADLK